MRSGGRRRGSGARRRRYHRAVIVDDGAQVGEHGDAVTVENFDIKRYGFPGRRQGEYRFLRHLTGFFFVQRFSRRQLQIHIAGSVKRDDIRVRRHAAPVIVHRFRICWTVELHYHFLSAVWQRHVFTKNTDFCRTGRQHADVIANKEMRSGKSLAAKQQCCGGHKIFLHFYSPGKGESEFVT
ncbi:hypothetical protein CKO_00360 [Citrobacter koseri ATCC BAA-895]|uniref:Uncharacterized protein n=1 Tax=Citrobacter koseri (strain ATCC BAA-895 / CDC 4225-83 / SGSC4696) TaxID=290338 RepID=A8ADG1_CITK8|nr:hypothetical protein CKO_00360 [Citrobacter koseri ATCC BAA-895]